MFARALAALTIVNLVAFCCASYYLGGDALNGRAQGGRFYLEIHGRSTEVSQDVYLYSKWHALSVITMVAAHLIWVGWTRWRRHQSASQS